MTHRFTPSCGRAGQHGPGSRRVAAATAAGQTKASTGKTVDGHPDLQGKWNFSTITPYERPAEFAGKATFTNEEAAAFERAVAGEHQQGPAGRGESGGGRVTGSSTARSRPTIWRERITSSGGTAAQRSPKRTARRWSWIRLTGRCRALTPEAQKRMAKRREVEARPAWGPEDRPAGERCIHQQRTGPPILPGGLQQPPADSSDERTYCDRDRTDSRGPHHPHG